MLVVGKSVYRNLTTLSKLSLTSTARQEAKRLEERSCGVENRRNTWLLVNNLIVSWCCFAELPRTEPKHLIAFRSLLHCQAVLPVFWQHPLSMTEISLVIKGLHYKYLGPAIASVTYFCIAHSYRCSLFREILASCPIYVLTSVNVPGRLDSFPCSGFRNQVCCTNGLDAEWGEGAWGLQRSCA